jgi:tetratricopeptide (TPR) repeat protein
MRLVRLGAKAAEFVAPHVKELYRQRFADRLEGERHLQASNWVEAERHLKHALHDKYSKKRRAELSLGLARALQMQRKFDEAEGIAGEALESAIEGHSHDLISLSLEALVDSQIGLQKYDEAEKNAAEIVALEKERSSPSGARKVVGFRKRAAIMHLTDHPDRAQEALKFAMREAEHIYGIRHTVTAEILTDLGVVFRQRGMYPEAEQALRQAAATHSALSGPDSRGAVLSLLELAMALEESGDLENAAKEYERMLARTERQLGNSRERTAEVQIRLAAIYVQTERLEPARELLMQVIGVLERTGGPLLRTAVEGMAVIEDASGRGENAREWREIAETLAGEPAS